MRLYLDTVQGHEVDSGIGSGRISRMALAVASTAEMPLTVPTPLAIINALSVLGLPRKGDPYPHPDYQDYFLKRHIGRAFDSRHYGIEMVYEFRGLTTIQDTTTLSQVPSQLHPKDFTPLYVTYKPAFPGSQSFDRPLTLSAMLPMRHMTITKTVDFMAGPEVLRVFGCVNSLAWNGLPIGYWLFSGIEGQTVDNGITYTYSATFSTKQREDWSQLGFITDGEYPIPIPKTAVKTLRAKPYEYSIDDSVNGLIKVGMHDLADFHAVLGL